MVDFFYVTVVAVVLFVVVLLVLSSMFFFVQDAPPDVSSMIMNSMQMKLDDVHAAYASPGGIWLDKNVIDRRAQGSGARASTCVGSRKSRGRVTREGWFMVKVKYMFGNHFSRLFFLSKLHFG